MKKAILLVAALAAALAHGQSTASSAFTGVNRVADFPGATLDAKLNACISGVSTTFGGICDARSFGPVFLAGNVTVSNSNVKILLPCATITTAYQLVVSAGVRNTVLVGCSFQGGSASSSSAGGTVWNYTGPSAALQIGDATFASSTVGFSASGFSILTSGAGASASAMVFDQVQEIDLRALLLNGGSSTGQSGIVLDGTGNYTGGSFSGVHIEGYGEGLVLKGHDSGSATDDYANAGTFSRIHIDCPTSGGSPITGTAGIYISGGDGNTFVGGDVEGCSAVLHLGAAATANTITGLRWENTSAGILADGGSSYNLLTTGTTIATGDLTDSGTHNSFIDAFHRGSNGVGGDLYRSQIDSTITNHYYLGIGNGNIRGLLSEYTTDVAGSPGSYQNVWQWGPGDGTSGMQSWTLKDLVTNVPRFGADMRFPATDAQTYLNSVYNAAICLNCSTNAGVGGTIFGSGGASPTSVAEINGSGEALIGGDLMFTSGTTSSAWTWWFNCSNTTACAINDAANSNAHRLRLYPGGASEIDSAGTAAITFNNTSTSGTGGFIVYEGGPSNYNTQSFRLDSSGNPYLPQLHSNSGTRYLCIDTSGEVHSSTTACSGT